MGTRSSCEGFRSIISRWSWRVSITVSRDTPVGIGVIVVKIVRAIFATVWTFSHCLTILNLKWCFVSLSRDNIRGLD